MSSRARAVVTCCAVVGVAVTAVQAWAYGDWLLTSPREPIRSSVSVPSDVTRSVRTAELTSIIGAILWLGYVGWDWRRRRTLTWPLLWTVAWACVFWQEPLVNVRTHTFSFNKEFHNLGDWTTSIPFVPDSYSPLPEALVLEGLVFVYLLPLLAVVVPAYLRFLRRRLRIQNTVVLVAIGYLTVVAFDLVFELQGVHQGLLRYVELGGPAISAGEPEQWPWFEGFAIGAAWAFPGIATFLIRDRKKPQPQGPRWWSGRRAIPVTMLAAIGATNLGFGVYNAAYVVVMNGTVSQQPAWLDKCLDTCPG